METKTAKNAEKTLITRLFSCLIAVGHNGGKIDGVSLTIHEKGIGRFGDHKVDNQSSFVCEILIPVAAAAVCFNRSAGDAYLDSVPLWESKQPDETVKNWHHKHNKQRQFFSRHNSA